MSAFNPKQSFARVALGIDEDEPRWEESLKKIAKAQPPIDTHEEQLERS